MLMKDRLMPDHISLLISDVDGTLVTQAKALTDRTREAVRRLRDAGIAFALTSSRPPRGLQWLIEALEITTPVVGFNGGMIVTPDLSPIEQHLLPPEIARRAVAIMPRSGPRVWVFSGNDWLLQDPAGAYVGLEERTVKFPPTIVGDFGAALDSAAKIVGVSDDFASVARCETEMRRTLGDGASVARSQPYYLDITHRSANKGAAVATLARLLAVPRHRIATIGDGANDVPMFKESGLSIAMGNAEPDVKYAADLVTGSNEADGFADAVERHILAAERVSR
jgi:Cof subfamily protein (haloacid dehalogenase superfamily)